MDERGHVSPFDSGFSLVEVIVAMMLLALLALVTLPLFMTTTRVTTDSASTTSATDQVSAALEQVRSKPDCADVPAVVQSLNQPANQTHYDAQHRGFTVTVSVTYASGTCTKNQTATVTATATRGSTTLSSASTVIFLVA